MLDESCGVRPYETPDEIRARQIRERIKDGQRVLALSDALDAYYTLRVDADREEVRKAAAEIIDMLTEDAVEKLDDRIVNDAMRRE